MLAHCEFCNVGVKTAYTVKTEEIETRVKGVYYYFDGPVARCDTCGDEVFVAWIRDENLERLDKEIGEVKERLEKEKRYV